MIFGFGPPTSPPTDPPTNRPAGEPDHDDDKMRDRDTATAETLVVTTMSSTGHGAERGGNTAMAAFFGAMALVLTGAGPEGS